MLQEFCELARQISDWHKLMFPCGNKSKQVRKVDEAFNAWDDAETDEERMNALADAFIASSILWLRFEKSLGRFLLETIVEHVADDEDCFYNAIFDKIEKKSV